MVEFFAGPAAIGDFSVFGRPADALRARLHARGFSQSAHCPRVQFLYQNATLS
jgi:hypothetical protein